MAAKTKKGRTIDEAWVTAIKSMSGKTKAIASQLEAAEEQFPDLVTGFKVLLGYGGYRANQRAFAGAMSKLNGVVSYTPYPPGPDPIPDLLRQICRNPHPIIQQFCKCLDGDPSSCPDPDEEDRQGRPSPDPVSPCPALCRSYREALECALQFCDETGAGINEITREQYADWVSCQADVDSYWRQLHDQGCFNRLQPISILLELAKHRFG